MEGLELAEGVPEGSMPEDAGVPDTEQRDSGAAAGPGANGEAAAGAGAQRQHVRNKEKVLVLSSRGIVYRCGWLMPAPVPASCTRILNAPLLNPTRS